MPLNFLYWFLMLINQLGNRVSLCRCYWLCLLMVSIYLIQLQFWWPDQHLIPNVLQLVFANISVKGWVIDSNQHSLSDCSSHALVIPAHNAEIVQGHFMTSGPIVVIDGWWWPQVLPESFSKCFAWLPYVFILTVHPATCVSIYPPHSSLVCHPYLLDGLGVAWWHWPLWNAFQCHVFCRCFCSFHSVPSYRAALCMVSYCCWYCM